MKNLRKKVMILNNFTSPYISEAILILKDYDPSFDTKAIIDAERIVNEYINKNDGQSEENVRPGKKLIKICSVGSLMLVCFIVGYCLR